MRRFASVALTFGLPLLAMPAQAQSDFDAVEIKAEIIAPGVAVLFGEGGNIGVSYGEDATVIIDDQFASLSPKIEAAVAGLGAAPVKYLVNTHWHYDHTGGNENFGNKGAIIFAHDNVRVRLAAGGIAGSVQTPPASKAALPVVTYSQGVSFHLNGDTIDLAYVGGGHTDGDSVVLWAEKNVIHMGDLYFNIAGFPFADIGSGGNVVKLMASLDAVIPMIDDETRVIPGHGPISNKAELVAYREMIGEAVARVEELRSEGSTLEETIAAQPLADLGRNGGFVSPDAFVTAIWHSLED